MGKRNKIKNRRKCLKIDNIMQYDGIGRHTKTLIVINNSNFVRKVFILQLTSHITRVLIRR